MAPSLIIATIGTFDGVHLGHQSLLRELSDRATALGMRPAIVTFDPMPSVVLRPHDAVPQLTTTSERVSLLRQLGFDSIILLNFNESLAALSAEEFMGLLAAKYGVNTLLLGYDHQFGRGAKMSYEDYAAIAQRIGMSVIKADPLLEGSEAVSSSRIRTALLSGQTAQANALLGRPYSISGQVVGGLQIGRSLGYPTANIKPDDAMKLIPQDGVYAVRIYLDNCVCGERQSMYHGMLSIGNRPTLGEDLNRTIEVHVFDLETNLYAKKIRVEFIEYIRANQKFDSLDSLQSQIARDERQIRTLFNKG